jgi:two-component system, cell cycle response regulator DivK
MIARRLRKRGYEVAVALDGAEAVRLAKAGNPDLVLMDMSLPVMHGWDATREIKADADTCSLPVIALTAHAMEDDRRRAMEAGCDEFESKPIDLPRLLEKMDALLEKAKSG